MSNADKLIEALGLVRDVRDNITDNHPDFQDPDRAHESLSHAAALVENVLSDDLGEFV